MLSKKEAVAYIIILIIVCYIAMETGVDLVDSFTCEGGALCNPLVMR